MSAPPWPTRADGTRKTFGEMTPEERRIQVDEAARRMKAHFLRPDVLMSNLEGMNSRGYDPIRMSSQDKTC